MKQVKDLIWTGCVQVKQKHVVLFGEVENEQTAGSSLKQPVTIICWIATHSLVLFNLCDKIHEFLMILGSESFLSLPYQWHNIIVSAMSSWHVAMIIRNNFELWICAFIPNITTPF